MNLINLIINALKTSKPPKLAIKYVNRGNNIMQTPEINKNAPISYNIFDHLIVKPMSHIENYTSLRFSVDRYVGGGYASNSIEGVAANAYLTVVNTLNGLQHILPQPPTKWAAVSNLEVYPFAGRGLNAFYNRKLLAFFYQQDQSKNWFFTASSPDIVAHELGHAILDAMRPDLWDAASVEIWAFHEAFGDIVSMLSLLQYEEVIDYMYTQTQGNLRTHNLVSDLAENFGKIISDGEQGYLRSAINPYKYVEPHQLKESGSDGELLREPHSFSRIFFGAIYDILVGIYETEIRQGMDHRNALIRARDIVANYVGRAIQSAPASTRFFESMAKTMLWLDFNSGKPWHDMMWNIFVDRKIISPFQAQSFPILSTSGMKVEDKKITVSHTKCSKLCHHKFRAQNVSGDGLDEIDLTLVRTDCYLYDRHNNLIHSLCTSEEETISAAEEMVNYLRSIDGVSNSPTAPFEILNGALHRSLICCCGGDGKRQPLKTSPEYLKQYKPLNNGGCCSGCRPREEMVIKNPTKIRGCYTRYKF